MIARQFIVTKKTLTKKYKNRHLHIKQIFTNKFINDKMEFWEQ